MNNLDDIKKVENLDKQSMYKSIEELGLQIQQGWEDVNKIKIPFSKNEIKNILVCGMGGSALGARIIEALYSEVLTVPFKIYGNYGLPKFVNKNTLVIVSSYSGSTEETVEDLKLSQKRGAKILVIAAGSTLIDQAKKHKIPFYQIVPDHNPCGQPRMAVGYSIIGQLGMLNKIGLICIKNSEIKSAQVAIDRNNKKYGVKAAENKNSAKQLARKIYGRVPILVSSDHLVGATYTARNQFNENGKNYCDQHTIPELNHHLMESLGFPKTNPKNLFGVLINSKLYHPRNSVRIKLTVEVMSKNKIPTYLKELTSSNKFAQVFETLHFLSYVNYYLALLNGIDPSPIPWVDYFKDKLIKYK